MHIGFDISQTGDGKAGCGFFTHALIAAMIAIAPENKYDLYPSFGDFFFDSGMPEGNPYGGANVSYGPHHDAIDAAREFWTQDKLETALGQPDLIHSNNFWSPIQLTTSKLIYTLYDIGFAVDPDWTTERNRVGCFEGVFRSAAVADWVIAISDFTRQHFLKLFPHFPADRVRVVYPCSRFTDAERKGAPPVAAEGLEPGKFWLSVGTIEPRKNQRMLVLAYKNYLDAGGRPMPLVLAGGKGWLMDNFGDYVASLGLSEFVIIAGYVSDDEMIWLYRNCFASLYPSLFEGFGLPVLEGMQFGAPTLSSNATSMPEVTGDNAILISPLVPDDWTRSMLNLAGNESERERLKIDAVERAAQFNWKKSARAVLDIYSEATRSPRRRDLPKMT